MLNADDEHDDTSCAKMPAHAASAFKSILHKASAASAMETHRPQVVESPARLARKYDLLAIRR